MNKWITQLVFITVASVLLTAGTALAAEEKGQWEVLEEKRAEKAQKEEAKTAEDKGIETSAFDYEGIYDNNFGDDWFYDSYTAKGYETGEDELRGYFGEQKDADWFSDDEYYRGYYDDGDLTNDWWFDSYGDAGDSKFWDF